MTGAIETRDTKSGTRPNFGIGRVPRLASLVSTIALGIVCIACGSTPERVEPAKQAEAPPSALIAPLTSLGDEIALRAIAQVGKQYIYGGADLNGFDCSGLVFYIHRELGYTVPRTAADQYSASTPIKVGNLKPGDLLFFRTTSGKKISHVAIYAGEGRFVHAPQSGRAIELRDLEDDYYRPRLVGAGRLHAERS